MIQQLLESADTVIARSPHCWLMTLSKDHGVNARPMGRVQSMPSKTDWTLYFLADARSEKVGDLHSTARVRLIFEQGDDAFVGLAGAAEVISDTAVIMQRWLPSYDRIFLTAAEKANAVFIDIRADELRLWIRGLTPEPFGARSLTLHRPLNGAWRVEMQERS